MKIGDRVFIHGYVDEIRKDTVIIRNKGGYFGTDRSEVIVSAEEIVPVVRCKDCKHHETFLFDDSKLLCWVHDTDIVVSPADYCSYGERIEGSEVKSSCQIIHDALSADAAQGWIPCSDRLPNEDGCYLVCMNLEYNNMDVLKWADGWNCFRYPDGKVSRESEIDGADIIAWMPLPEPYREEGK